MGQEGLGPLTLCSDMPGPNAGVLDSERARLLLLFFFFSSHQSRVIDLRSSLRKALTFQNGNIMWRELDYIRVGDSESWGGQQG